MTKTNLHFDFTWATILTTVLLILKKCADMPIKTIWVLSPIWIELIIMIVVIIIWKIKGCR